MATSRFGEVLARAARIALVVLALAGLGSAPVAAQAGTVTGIVRDAVTGAPLAGAQVSVEGTGIGGLANNVGRYLLLNVPAGEQTISVTLI
ncbi:MAG TPA: carboxypeptidase-like regulatory domain-containing protein, partial [Longimicrobiales bacterium]|nr:carboxypeptidase-like regulatory domain-containing protein [Longimicrobiales bacterium]